MALDQVESSLPDDASHAYEEFVAHHEEGLTALFRTGRPFMILSNTPMASLEEATAYFKKVLEEHLEKKRSITLFAIAVVDGRLKSRRGITTMIKLEGTVLNVFTQQGGKDKKTGDQFADRDKVQILGAMDLPNGDVKNELFTLSVENYRDFSDFLNQKISIAVGAIASGRNVIFMSQKAQSLNWQKLCETPKKQ